jgi:hypothetical protein
MVQEFSLDCHEKCYFGYWETFFGDLGHFEGPLVKSHFFQLVAFKLGFHLHFLHLVVFSLCHRIDPTELRHRTIIVALEVS